MEKKQEADEDLRRAWENLLRPLKTYRPWSERLAWLHIVAAIGLITFVAVFHDWLMSPDLLAEENAADARGWINTALLWMDSVWAKALVWTGVGVAAVNLTKGVIDAFIHKLHRRSEN
jgi:hypothetical protein